jgi:hypothetical protein
MEAAAAPNAIKPITRILMFPPLSERNLKPALLDRRVPGAKGISGVERLCHRKSAWRRDVLILSYRNVGSIAEMRAKTRVGRSPPKPLGRACIRNRRISSCARSPWFSSGQDPLPSSAATSRRFEMATGCIWPGGQLPVISIAARAAGIGPIASLAAAHQIEVGAPVMDGVDH